MSMNLVAIAGLPPEATPGPVYERRRPFGQVPTEADKSLMWMSLGAFGAAVIAGYFLGKRMVP